MNKTISVLSWENFSSNDITRSWSPKYVPSNTDVKVNVVNEKDGQYNVKKKIN